MKKFVYILAMLALLQVSAIQAAEWSNFDTIGKLSVRPSGEIWIYPGTSEDWALPTEGCTRNIYAVLPTTVGGFNQMYALVVASKFEQSTLRLLANGCVTINGNTYPLVRQVETQ